VLSVFESYLLTTLDGFASPSTLPMVRVLGQAAVLRDDVREIRAPTSAWTVGLIARIEPISVKSVKNEAAVPERGAAALFAHHKQQC